MISVMSLVLGLGLPRISAVRTAFLVDEQARELAAFVRAARLDAVTNRTTTAVTPAGSGVLELQRVEAGTWRVEPDTTPQPAASLPAALDGAAVVRRIRLDGAVGIEAKGAAGIVFRADGSSGGGEIVLRAAEGGPVHRLRVDAATGAVMIQREASS